MAAAAMAITLLNAPALAGECAASAAKIARLTNMEIDRSAANDSGPHEGYVLPRGEDSIALFCGPPGTLVINSIPRMPNRLFMWAAASAISIVAGRPLTEAAEQLGLCHEAALRGENGWSGFRRFGKRAWIIDCNIQDGGRFSFTFYATVRAAGPGDDE